MAFLPLIFRCFTPSVRNRRFLFSSAFLHDLPLLIRRAGSSFPLFERSLFSHSPSGNIFLVRKVFRRYPFNPSVHIGNFFPHRSDFQSSLCAFVSFLVESSPSRTLLLHSPKPRPSGAKLPGSSQIFISPTCAIDPPLPGGLAEFQSQRTSVLTWPLSAAV